MQLGVALLIGKVQAENQLGAWPDWEPNLVARFPVIFGLRTLPTVPSDSVTRKHLMGKHFFILNYQEASVKWNTTHLILQNITHIWSRWGTLISTYLFLPSLKDAKKIGDLFWRRKETRLPDFPADVTSNDSWEWLRLLLIY